MVNPDTVLPSWLTDQYPFHPHTQAVFSGARMSYVDEGPRSDHAVLMLHGNPTWSFYYRNLVSALCPGRRCIVPDHIGMGLSDKPQAYPYTLAQRIADIETLVQNLNLKRVDLILHDWGGAIGLGWAGRNPDKVGRIVLLNTGAFHSKLIPRRIALCKNHPIGTWLVRGLNAFAGPATWMSMSRSSLTELQQKAFLFPYSNWHDRVAVNAFVKDIPLSPTHESFDTLTQVEKGLAQVTEKEILLFWGGKDFCFNRHFHDRFLQLLPKAKSTFIADAGHYVIEDAKNEALQTIPAFLR